MASPDPQTEETPAASVSAPAFESIWVTKPGRPYKQWSTEQQHDPSGWFHPHLTDRPEALLALPDPAEAELYPDGENRWETAFLLTPRNPRDIIAHQYGSVVVRWLAPEPPGTEGIWHADVRMHFNIGYVPGPPLFLEHRFNVGPRATFDDVRSRVTYVSSGWMWEMWRDAWEGSRLRHREQAEKIARTVQESIEARQARCATFEGALAELDRIRTLPEGWDGPGSEPIPDDVTDPLRVLLTLLHSTCEEADWPPLVMPHFNGAVSLTWQIPNEPKSRPHLRISVWRDPDRAVDDPDQFTWSIVQKDDTAKRGYGRGGGGGSIDIARGSVTRWINAHKDLRVPHGEPQTPETND